MRKRQFKKVLSLVLALALVFTMNTSVFATSTDNPAPAADPVAEEPAAEENAETPVTNDEKPVEEKKEETPAPAAEETPADTKTADDAAPVEKKKEEAAPATEETPANETPAAPKAEAQTEDAVGTSTAELLTAAGWGSTGIEGDNNYATGTPNTLTLGTAATITLTATDTASDFTFAGSTAQTKITVTGHVNAVTLTPVEEIGGITLGTDTYAIVGTKLYYPLTGEDPTVIPAGTTPITFFKLTSIVPSAYDYTVGAEKMTLAATTEVKPVTGANLDTIGSAEADPTAVDVSNVTSTAGLTYLFKVTDGETSKDSYNVFTTIKRAADPNAITLDNTVVPNPTGNTAVIKGDEGAVFQWSVKDSGSWSDVTAQTVFPSTGKFKLTGLTKNTAYDLRTYKPAVERTSFASTIIDSANLFKTLNEDDPEPQGDVLINGVGPFTVSGITITGKDEKTKGSIVSTNNIWTVTISAGDATVTAREQDKNSMWAPISINVVDEKSTLTFANLAATANYSNLSIEGKGTVLFDLKSAKKALFDSFDSQLSVSSASAYPGYDMGLVISDNSGKYTTIVGGVDTKKSISTKGKTAIYFADGNAGKDMFAEYESLNIVTVNGGSKVYYVLSENKLVKVVNGDINLTKANSTAAIYYGNTVFGTLENDADPASAGFGFRKVMPRNTNPVTSIAFYDAMVGDKGASFYVAAPSSLSEKDLNTVFQDKKIVFAISESSAVYTKDLSSVYKSVIGGQGDDPDKKYYYSLNSGYLTEGSELKPNTTYHVFILNTETDGFYSEPAEVGSFTTAAAQTQITLGNASGTIYYGGQGPKKIINEYKKVYADHPDNALEAGNISVTIGTTGYKVEPNYSRNCLEVVDPADSNYKVGEVWTYMFTRDTYYAPGNAEIINSAKTSSQLLSDVTPTKRMDRTGYSYTDNLTEAVSDNGWFMKSFFVPEKGSKYGSSGQISSNVISFNVVAAPVDIQARALKAPVKTYLKSGVVEPDYGEDENTRLAFKNTITEEVTELTNDDIIVNSSAVYTTNGKRMEEATSTVSYDSAGVYSYQISADTIKPVLTAPGAAKYKINSIGEGKLSIFGEVTTSSFSITPAKVFYGENGDTIKNNMTITYNNGAESAKKIDGSVTGIEFYKTVSGDGTISAGSAKISGAPEAQEAGSEFYAQVTVPAAYIDAKDAKEVKLVAKITVEKRPVEIYLAGEKFSTFRNIEPKPETLSGGKAAGESTTTVYTSKTQLGTAEEHAYSSTLATKDILSKNAAFDMSYVDLTVSADYVVPLTGVELISPQAKNFEVVKATGKYIVKPAWYGYFILEYGGHEGKNSTAKKTIYKQTYYADNGDGTVKWKLPKELETISAAQTFNGALTDSKDKVAEFEAYPKNSDGSIGSADVQEFVKNGLPLGNNYGDVYFYAIVNAYATEDVYVQTISPKVYSGNKHIVDDDTDKIVNGAEKSIDLVVRRNKKGNEAFDPYLELGKDFTVSVKNNINASVKYDSSQSVSSDLGESGAVTQLFKPAKRPQVVITGKGDYKGMKATVYFDILPININDAELKNEGALQTKTYSQDIALAYNHLRLGKKGGITYKYKVKDNLWLTNKKDGQKKKTVTLGTKDYDELFVQANEYPTSNTKAIKILGSGSKEAKKAAKAITAPGKNYAVQLKGKGNYYGTITYPINVVSKDVMLLSELAWKASKVSYKAAGVSSDTAKGNFNVKTSKKINKKKLVYGTDFGATIEAKNNGAKMGDGKEVPANLASYAGNYTITIVPLAPLKTLANEGKIILDTATVTGTVKGKKLSSKMFTVTGTAGGKSIDKKGKIDYTGANIDDIKIASTKVTEGKQYVALPTSYTSNNENYSGADVVEKCGESEVYVDYWTGKLQNPDNYEDLNSMAFNNKGVQVNAHTYSYTFNASNAEANYGDTTYGNKRPGTYYIYIKGKGEYAGSYVPVKYTVNGAKLDLKKNANLLSADTCYVNINGAEPGFSLTLPFEVTPFDGAYAGKKTKIVTDKSIAAYDDNGDPIYYFTTGKFTGNTKVNDKAGVTITPTTYSGYLTKGVKGNFKIQTKTVSASDILSANEFETGDLGENLAGKIFVSVEDKYTKAKTPVVKVYQANIEGKKGWKELKKKSDYQFVEILSGGVSNNTINIKDGTSKKPNFKFDDKTIKGSLSPNKVFYDIYSTQGKKWELEISQNAYFVSGNDNKKVEYAFKELNSKQDSGKIVYNGRTLVPQIQNLTVDGVQVIVNGKPAKKGVNAKIIMGDNAGKVGTNKYTIVLTKDETGYTLGGSKVYKFQIVPQDNKNLVLEK